MTVNMNGLHCNTGDDIEEFKKIRQKLKEKAVKKKEEKEEKDKKEEAVKKEEKEKEEKEKEEKEKEEKSKKIEKEETAYDTYYKVPFGIDSGANTCFLNSVLQSIINMKQFIVFLKSNEKNNDVYTNLMDIIKDNTDKVSPAGELCSPSITYGKQNDASEFFSGLLGKIAELYPIRSVLHMAKNNQSEKTSTTEIEKINELELNKILYFFGFIHEKTSQDQILRVSSCGEKTRAYINNNRETANKASEKDRRTFIEEVDKINNSNKNIDLSTKINDTSFKLPPNILSIQVELCSYYLQGTSHTLPINMEIPITVKIKGTNFDYDYEFSSVIIHIGVITGGHYYCILRRNDNYYYCSDSTIKELKKNDNDYFKMDEGKMKFGEKTTVRMVFFVRKNFVYTDENLINFFKKYEATLPKNTV